jgi:hypothetical protein
LHATGTAASNTVPPVMTDTSGRFHFESVQPGRYTLVADRNAYIGQPYGARAPGGQGAVFEVIAASHLTGLNITMTPQGIISGTVQDEDGEALANSQVVVYKMGYQDGKRQLIVAAFAQGNADGTFVAGHLVSGKYYLSVSATTRFGAERPGAVTPTTGYVTTYYPSTAEASGATAIDVSAGVVIRGADIRSVQARVFSVRGKVTGVAAGVSAPDMILLREGLWAEPFPAVFNPRDGSFVFAGVAPGSYVIRANGLTPNTRPAASLVAYTRVTVVDQDLDDVAVAFGPALSVSGVVRLEGDGQTPEPPLKPNLQISMRETGQNFYVGVPVQTDGTFDLHGLVPEKYRVTIPQLPPGTYIKRIRFGGVDITHDFLDLTSGSSGALEILPSPKAAVVSGVVRNENGDPMSNVPVTLWTSGQPASGVYDAARNANTDATGAFKIDNLAPGEYRVAAWEEIEQGLAQYPDFRARFESTAAKVIVQESSQATADLKIVSREAILAEIAKLP